MSSGLELLTVAEMARADALAMAGGIASAALMDRAGTAVADAVSRLAPTGAKVAVLCGPGQNGGDGFVAARVLALRGYRVEVGLLEGRGPRSADAAAAAAKWSAAPRRASDMALSDADIIVDALFGAGLARDLAGPALAAVEAMAAAGRPIVAVDLPSGVDGDSGQLRPAAAPARETVTFFRLKPGHLLFPGRRLCGVTRLAEIGIPAAVLDTIAPSVWRNLPHLWAHCLRPPRQEAHKYHRGHAVIVSGGLEGTGAARLAARAALRSGAGLVSVAAPPEAMAAHAGALDAVMLRCAQGAQGLAGLLADRRRNAVVLGPALGVGEETRAQVAAALAASPAIVLDADALTSFAGDVRALAALIAGRAAPAASRAEVVLTPHEGEFAALFAGEAVSLALPSKVERARAAASLSGAVVVLKGPDTVIAAPDGRAAINDNGSPWLATAGSGDVLAGIVGGLLAQSMPAFEAACAAVWLHGAAGTAVGAGLIAEDLPQALPGVLARFFSDYP